MSVIARAPVAPPATSPLDPRFFDERDLESELRRAFQICHECRMCVNYCGSFPDLFKRIDRDIETRGAEGAELIDYDDVKSVSDACWQCKLCYIKCPYTPDEGSKELLDFPRLMAREKAVRAQREGIPLVDQILAEPQLVGQLGSGKAAPIANLISANRLLRKVQEKVTGISAEFPLPPMATETFGDWFEKHTPPEGVGEAGEVVLFSTCYGDFNTPSVPRAAVMVLEHNGYKVFRASEEALCCGMPALDGGDIAGATKKMKKGVDALIHHVRAGRKVLVPGPTCGYTMKKEWAEYLPTDETKEVAAATLDLMEFLLQVGRAKKLKREFGKGFGKVAYHAACHLRAQKIGFPGARLLGLLPDTDVEVLEECSAVDGTWGMKAAHYDEGVKYSRRLVNGVNETEPALVVSDCTLSGFRMAKENATRVLHPVEALAQAYGLDFGEAGVVDTTKSV
jgi:glycerol-3-phosphate dehydrogenase subunit C